jgi:hypothetical protein
VPQIQESQGRSNIEIIHPGPPSAGPATAPAAVVVVVQITPSRFRSRLSSLLLVYPSCHLLDMIFLPFSILAAYCLPFARHTAPTSSFYFVGPIFAAYCFHFARHTALSHFISIHAVFCLSSHHAALLPPWMSHTNALRTSNQTRFGCDIPSHQLPRCIQPTRRSYGPSRPNYKFHLASSSQRNFLNSAHISTSLLVLNAPAVVSFSGSEIGLSSEDARLPSAVLHRAGTCGPPTPLSRRF